MTKSNRYYSLAVNGATAELDIYGDIRGESSWGGKESDWNAYRLSKKLQELEGVSQINVNINSYGGDVSEGIAIYNALRRHNARVVTRCDGMACSIASVIFMAGEERIMYAPSMLMIHNASTMGWGTAADLRKAADDAEKITSMSKAAYLAGVNIDEETLTQLMDAETWISPSEALEMGFATVIEGESDESNPTQSVRGGLMSIIMAAQQAADDDDDEDDPDDTGEADPDDGDEADDGQGGDDADPDDDDEDGGASQAVDGEGDRDDPDDDADDESDADEESEQKASQAFCTFIQSAFK